MLLTTVLQRHRNDIASAWIERICRLPGSRYRDCAHAEISAWCTSAIDAIVRTLDTGSDEQLRAHATEMARERAGQGFDIDEVIEGLLLLNQAALPFIVVDGDEAKGDAIAAALALDANLRLMVAQFARLFAASKRQAVEQVAILEERHRLARDLHDLLSQSLCGVAMCTEAAARLLEAGDVGTAVARLRDARDSAGEALREMRFLVFELRPSILQEEGLVEALATRLASVERRVGVHAELDAEGVGPLPFPIQEALYGIAREALNNSLRHAHATRLSVTVRQAADCVTLDVSDNGVGFDPKEAWSRGRMGLTGMRERAERIAASFHVVSRVGHGTSVSVSAPLAEPPVPVRKEPSR